MTTLIALSGPELREPRNNVVTSRDRRHRARASNVTTPNGVLGEALSQKVRSTFIEGPSVSRDALLNEMRIEDISAGRLLNGLEG
jgi:hypothetical protein